MTMHELSSSSESSDENQVQRRKDFIRDKIYRKDEEITEDEDESNGFSEKFKDEDGSRSRKQHINMTELRRFTKGMNRSSKSNGNNYENNNSLNSQKGRNSQNLI